MTFGKKLFLIIGALVLVNVIGFTALFVIKGSALFARLAQIVSGADGLQPVSADPKVTIEETTKTIAKSPKDAKAYARRAEAYYWLSRYEESLRDYDMAISLKNDMPLWYKERGKIHEYLDQDDAGIADYTHAIQLDSHFEDAYAARADLYKEMGKVDLALADYEKALHLSFDPNLLYLKRGELYKDQGEVEKAMRDFKSASKGTSYWANQARRRQASWHEERGEQEKAEEIYSEWIKLTPDDEWAYEKRAQCYEKNKQPEKARADWEKALALLSKKVNENHSDAINFDYRGDVYKSLGKMNEAKKDWKKAVQLLEREDNNVLPNGYSYDLIEELYEKLGDNEGLQRTREQGLKVLNERIKQEAPKASCYYNRGLIYAKARDFKKAAADFSEAVKLDPRSAYYRRHHAYMLVELEDYEHAIPELRQCIELAHGKTASDFVVLSKSLEYRGKHQEALVAANKALGKKKNYGRAYYWRARSEQSLGDAQAAESDFKRAKFLGIDEN